MKQLATIFVLLGQLTALGIALPALAQQETQRSGNIAQEHPPERMRQYLQQRRVQPNSDGNRERQMTSNEPPDRQTSEQQTNPGQGRERLSPEERRQLRRDINAAGRDIYRRTGRP